MNRHQKHFIIFVTSMIVLSFFLPKFITDIQENQLLNKSITISGEHYSINDNLSNAQRIIYDKQEFFTVYSFGNKTKASSVPSNEKSEVVLIELVENEIAKLKNMGVLENVDLDITNSAINFLYEYNNSSAQVWEFYLEDKQENRMILQFHSGINKIVSINYRCIKEYSNLEVEKMFIAFYNYLNDIDENLDSIKPSINNNYYQIKMFDQIDLIGQYSNNKFEFNCAKKS